jgi:hypothetical protein
MFGGYSAFAERIKVLREKLIPKGWRNEIVNGLELVVNDALKISLAACTGACTTGDESEGVQSKYSKGLATRKAIAQNQLSFDENILALEGAKPNSPEQYTTWYLMVHRQSDIIRYELCLPVGFDEENRISETKERIIFDQVLMSDLMKNLAEITMPEADNSDEEIVVDVSRRT